MEIKKENLVKVEGDVFDNKKTQINEKKLSKLFHLLSNIYKDVLGSIVREYASNCWDANKSAGKEASPIIIRLKKDGSNNILEFEDFGTGITPENFDSVFINYLDSTKELDNENIGGFGIGAKSFFAYTNSFQITTFVDGIEYKYIFRKDENGIPTRDLLLTKSTERENGTIISGFIKNEDLENLAKVITSQTMYLPNIYYDIDSNVTGNYYTRNELNKIKNDYKIIDSKDFIINTFYSQREYKLHLSLGNVAYTIDFDKISDLKKYQNLPLALKFNIGELQPTPSREDILYSREAIEKIIKKAEDVCKYLIDLYNKSQDFECDNITDVIEKTNLDNFDHFPLSDSFTIDLECIPLVHKEGFVNEFTLKEKVHPTAFNYFKEERHWITLINYNCYKKYYLKSSILKNTEGDALTLFPKNISGYKKDNCKYFIYTSEENKKDKFTIKQKSQFLVYDRDIKEDLVIIKKSKSSLKHYIKCLHLGDIPREDWRQCIKDYIKLEEQLINDLFENINDITPSKEFLDSLKIEQEKKELKGSIPYKNYSLTPIESSRVDKLKQIKRSGYILISSNIEIINNLRDFGQRNYTLIYLSEKQKKLNMNEINNDKRLVNLDDLLSLKSSNFLKNIFTYEKICEELAELDLEFLSRTLAESIKKIDFDLYEHHTKTRQFTEKTFNNFPRNLEENVSEVFKDLKEYYYKHEYFNEVYFNHFIPLRNKLLKLPLLQFIDNTTPVKYILSYFRSQKIKINPEFYMKLSFEDRLIIKRSIIEINEQLNLYQNKVINQSLPYNARFEEKNRIYTKIEEFEETKAELELFNV